MRVEEYPEDQQLDRANPRVVSGTGGISDTRCGLEHPLRCLGFR